MKNDLFNMSRVFYPSVARIIIPPSFLFLFNVYFIAQGYYSIFPYVDVVFHFLGGLFITIALLESFRIMRPGFLKGICLDCFFLVASTVFIAVLWEFGEFFIDAVYDLHLQGGLIDTMEDLILGTTGGVVGVLSILFWQFSVIPLVQQATEKNK